MAKSYVKFEVSKEVSNKALEAIRVARQGGSVKKGVNEVTKSIERNMSSLVIIAEDVEPEEVVMHLPTLCEQRKIAYVYVPTKLALGQALGINVPCTAASIDKAAGADGMVKEVISKVSGKEVPAEQKSAEPKEKKEQKKPEKKAEPEKKHNSEENKKE